MKIIRDNDTDYEQLIKNCGGQLITLKTPEKKTELLYGNILLKIGDLVRDNYPWYMTLEAKQGIIKCFSEFHYNGESVPVVEIELFDGEIYKTHPSNIEKIDSSWLEMC